MINLEGADINQLSYREAMGLPAKQYTENVEVDSVLMKRYFNEDKDNLVSICESLQSNFSQRFAAGTVLAYRGDPRINTFRPMMINVPGSKKFRVGITKEKAFKVYETYKHLGVRLEWILKEAPSFFAAVPGFEMAKYPVTNMEYREFLLDSGHDGIPDSWRFGRYPSEKSNHPVNSIRVEDALSYIAWLNVKTGKEYRLPSELQWEFSACSDEGREFPWGNNFCSTKCNTLESNILSETPVGIYPSGQSRYGHFDMAGNVEEFVGSTYYAYGDDEVIEDDLLRINGKYFVAKGGSYARFSDLARGRRRHGSYPSPLYVMGFRLCH